MSNLPKKTRKDASNLVRMAYKVLAYRRDLMPTEAVQDIESKRDSLEHMLKLKEQAPRQNTVEQATKQLDHAMKPHGGNIYPVKFVPENVEMLLVAAILAIGIRTFFLQPFKIPTNSMWPTYAGMTEKVYNIDEPGPNLLEKAFNFVRLGAVNFNEPAPSSGEVLIPFGMNTKNGWQGVASYIPVKARKWIILPTVKHRYQLIVDNEPVNFDVPADFSLDEVIRQTYFPEYSSLFEAFQAAKTNGRIIQNQRGQFAIVAQKELKQGQSVLDFDIDTGDMLFVDRFTYNFVPPKIGDPIVFRTQEIPGLRDEKGAPAEQYYIKRMVGIGGDTLEVKAPELYRNGEPIQGADAFKYNADQVDGYPGYVPAGRLTPGQTDTIPDGYVYAMGDNSPHSFDSRSWGLNPDGSTRSDLNSMSNLNYVPEKEVIGQAFFIFYPFTYRWGPAE